MNNDCVYVNPLVVSSRASRDAFIKVLARRSTKAILGSTHRRYRKTIIIWCWAAIALTNKSLYCSCTLYPYPPHVPVAGAQQWSPPPAPATVVVVERSRAAAACVWRCVKKPSRKDWPIPFLVRLLADDTDVPAIMIQTNDKNQILLLLLLLLLLRLIIITIL